MRSSINDGDKTEQKIVGRTTNDDVRNDLLQSTLAYTVMSPNFSMTVLLNAFN